MGARATSPGRPWTTSSSGTSSMPVASVAAFSASAFWTRNASTGRIASTRSATYTVGRSAWPLRRVTFVGSSTRAL